MPDISESNDSAILRRKSRFVAVGHGRILHIAQSLKGGTASYLNETIPAQVMAFGSDRVCLLVPADDLVHLSKGARRSHIKTFPTRKRDAKSLTQFAWTVIHAVQSFRPDIVHLHNAYAGLIGRLIVPLLRRNAKIVYCAHGWSFDRNEVNASEFHKRCFTTVERALATCAHAIVNVSEADARSALARNVGGSKNLVIHNGVANVPVPYGRKSERQRAAGMDPDKINCLFVGRFDPQKGVDLAIRAMSDLDDSRYALEVVGERVVSARQSQELDGWLAERPGIKFHEWMSREDLVPLYAAADVVLMPSRWEAFGLVAVEAMRVGTPVVASRVGALPELVVDGVNGRLFPSGDISALQNVLKEESKASLRQYGLAARSVFEYRFSRDRMNDQILSLYDSLLGAERRDALDDAFQASSTQHLASPLSKEKPG